MPLLVCNIDSIQLCSASHREFHKMSKVRSPNTGLLDRYGFIHKNTVTSTAAVPSNSILINGGPANRDCCHIPQAQCDIVKLLVIREYFGSPESNFERCLHRTPVAIPLIARPKVFSIHTATGIAHIFESASIVVVD